MGFRKTSVRFIFKGILLLYVANLGIIMGRAYSTLTKNDCECVDIGTYFINNLIHLLVTPLISPLTFSPLAISFSSFRRPFYT